MTLEPKKADLLKRVVEGPLIDSDALSASGLLSEASAEDTLVEIVDEDGEMIGS